MYAGAFSGFAVAYTTGSLLLGLVAAIVVGLVAGSLMAFLTVTLGANQHVSGIGLTILLLGLSGFFQPPPFRRPRGPADRPVSPARGAHHLRVARPAVQPIRTDMVRLPGRRTGRMVGAESIVLRPRVPHRRRAPGADGRRR